MNASTAHSLSVLFALLAVNSATPQTGPATEAPKTGRIEGRVFGYGDGKPLAGSPVRLKREAEGFSAPDPFEAAHITKSDVGGVFLFEDIVPGSYRVYADQPGYVRGFHGARSVVTPSMGTVIKIFAGQVLKGIDVALSQAGSLSGRVLQDGEPVANIQVSALRTLYGGGRRIYVPMESTDTDADGRFTLRPLRPGKYYIRVDQTPPPRVAGKEKQGDRAAMVQAIRQRYYPDADSVESAVAVLVGSTEVQGIRFEVKPRKLLRVRGKVEWGGVPPPETGLVLQLATKAFDMRAAIRPNFASVLKDGTFVFEEVVPGAYFIEPARHFIDRSRQRRIGGRVEIEVREDDEGERDITFQVVAAPDINGSVQIEGPEAPQAQFALAGVPSGRFEVNRSQGAPPPPPPNRGSPGPPDPAPAQPQPQPAEPAKVPVNINAGTNPGEAAGQPGATTTADVSVANAIRANLESSSLAGIGILLHPTDRVSVNAPHATSDSGGRFELLSVAVGRYQVKVTNWPENTHIKAILFNGRDITTSGLDLATGAGGELSVVLRRRAGEIAGTVRDAKQDAVPGALVSVWRNVAQPLDFPELAQVVMADQGGAFRVGRLAPGEYKMVAWEEIAPGLAEIPSFCGFFASDAVTVRIEKDGSRHNTDLKSVPAARIQQAEWALPL